MAARLAALSPAAAAAAARRAHERLSALPEVAAARRILACLAFGDEIDTAPLVERWLSEGRELYVPRADPRDGALHVHRYPCALETLPFGLRQPRRGEPELGAAAIASGLDLVLVLGVAFDRRGFRLGHGRGYFDRFLAGRRLLAAGLAYDEQLVDRLPVEPHDVPMALVVTPSALIRR